MDLLVTAERESLFTFLDRLARWWLIRRGLLLDLRPLHVEESEDELDLLY